MFYICAQPSTFYYAWQVDTMLLSFEKCNIDLNKVHIVTAIHFPGIDAHFKKIESRWSEKGVVFAYYEDNRPSRTYISSVRPYILQQHWKKFPYLENEVIFYHDCDIALTRPIDNLHNMQQDDVVYLSDTISYIGAKYCESKGHDIFKKMCAIIDINEDLVRSREADSGGAQYMLKPGITAKFWQTVYHDCEELFDKITKENIKIKKTDPEYHAIQIWCSDMWAVLWNIWKSGWQTKVVKELDFSWGTNLKSHWDVNAIYHNAGVTEESYGGPFYKGKYMKTSPDTAPRPDDKWASQKYFDLVVEAWSKTTGKQIIKKRV